MDEPAPLRPRGMCPHARVITLCPICRERIPTAPRGTVRRSASSQGRRPAAMPTSAADARMMKAPAARGVCSVCKVEGTSRELVQDVEYRQYLCRAHARGTAFERVLYERAGRQGEAANPSMEDWQRLLDDASATGIRVYRGRARTPPSSPARGP